MNLLIEPYQPYRVRFSVAWADRPLITERSMRIHSGKRKANATNIIVAIVMLAIGVVASFIWLPLLPILLLTPLCWMIFPSSRIVAQVTIKHKIYDFERHLSPEIDWGLCERDPMYDAAVVEWIDMVRASGEVEINRESWSKYLDGWKQVSATTTNNNFKPNFELLTEMKKIMKG